MESVDPDLIAEMATEAWLMARKDSLRSAGPGMDADAATTQAILEFKARYPALGGTLRRLTVANTFGTLLKA